MEGGETSVLYLRAIFVSGVGQRFELKYFNMVFTTVVGAVSFTRLQAYIFPPFTLTSHL